MTAPPGMPTGREDASTRIDTWWWLRADSSFLTRVLVTALATANVILVVITVAGFFLSDVGYDWGIYAEAGARVTEGGLYRWDGYYTWIYSPVLAYAFALLAPLGFWGWTLLHVAVLGLLRDRGLAGVVLLSFPFWVDLYNGNTMTFVFVAAVGAMHRRPVAIGAFLLMCLVMPRPVMLPLLLWTLWKQPEWRVRFASMILMNVALVGLSGYGMEWLGALMGVTEFVAQSSRDIGPSNWLGGWWAYIGAALAVLLTLRGRIGWASVAASPYLLPHYLLMLLLELPRSRLPHARRIPHNQDEQCA